MSINLFKQVKLINLKRYGIRNTTQCKYLLEVLADFAHEKNDNLCIPEQATIANRMNAHPKTVARWAKELAKAKIIFIHSRTGTSNSYVFNPEIFQKGIHMNIPQSNLAPTISTITQSNTHTNDAPNPEQRHFTPQTNNIPLTLIDLNNAYFKILKKENLEKYIFEIAQIGEKLGLKLPMPVGDLEDAIKKRFQPEKTKEEIQQERLRAIEAFKNFRIKRVNG